MEKKLEAVALKYSGDYAPVIVAKEKGEVARKMIEIARENNIPVVEDEMLEQVLTLSEIGSYVPEESFEALAKIFAFIKEIEK